MSMVKLIALNPNLASNPRRTAMTGSKLYTMLLVNMRTFYRFTMTSTSTPGQAIIYKSTAVTIIYHNSNQKPYPPYRNQQSSYIINTINNNQHHKLTLS
ncbi:11437_t:CDS:2 [Funneliformis mosseae]|uniref:11437_t:CDS:1 n=1 Tax=Funneliformis mosseae TaxID=27381 RepID=A0A9N9A0N4_FUNMO|nr:11437_t:CDS:2 [Funneliformis mosseae]